jgi:large subunit ribosomal protein L22
MDIAAVTKFARISPLKARDLAREIQGRPVSEALKVTAFSERKAAFLLGKTLKAALANAKHNADLSEDDLIVKEAVVDDGPRFRRFWPRARGGVSPIRRRTANIKVVLTDGKTEGETK